MTSAQTTADMIRRMAPPQARTGFVRAVGSRTIDVQMGDTGALAVGLGWVASNYSPAVGDLVLVVPALDGWFVQGRVTTAAALLAEETVTIQPVHQWWMQKGYSANTPQGWFYLWDMAGYGGFFQGLTPEQSGGPGYIPRFYMSATLITWGDIASKVPPGSTITRATMPMRRSVWDPDGFAGPVMLAHAYDTSNPPPGDPPQASGPPQFIGGFGPYRPATYRPGEGGSVLIPSSFLTAMLARTIAGVGFYSEDPADRFQYANELIPALNVSYIPPAP